MMSDNQRLSNERLLIVSNNVLSNTSNNGKTILSYIDCLSKENVAQLYFNGEKPSVEGYKYFQISDKDIIKGKANPRLRGRAYEYVENTEKVNDIPGYGIPRNIYTLIIREILWWKSWKSADMKKWLNDFFPTSIFFVGGDSLFAYDICLYIAKKYNCKLSLYITDDYIVSRKSDNLLEKVFRKIIISKIKKTLTVSSNFYTVSEMMRNKYKEVFDYDSDVIVNMTDSLLDRECIKCNERIELIYAGSLYYGRDKIIGNISSAIERYNSRHEKKAFLSVFTNLAPDKKILDCFEIEGACKYCGSLDKGALKIKLNESDILVFVESFDDSEIEKTRYSLSTKVPEYLSLEKPILAVGPKGIGSIDYLLDVAQCVNDIDDLDETLEELLENSACREALSLSAKKKYETKHNKEKLQENFIRKVL